MLGTLALAAFLGLPWFAHVVMWFTIPQNRENLRWWIAIAAVVGAVLVALLWMFPGLAQRP